MQIVVVKQADPTVLNRLLWCGRSKGRLGLSPEENQWAGQGDSHSAGGRINLIRSSPLEAVYVSPSSVIISSTL